jgi:hypothetical protein
MLSAVAARAPSSLLNSNRAECRINAEVQRCAKALPDERPQRVSRKCSPSPRWLLCRCRANAGIASDLCRAVGLALSETVSGLVLWRWRIRPCDLRSPSFTVHASAFDDATRRPAQARAAHSPHRRIVLKRANLRSNRLSRTSSWNCMGEYESGGSLGLQNRRGLRKGTGRFDSYTLPPIWAKRLMLCGFHWTRRPLRLEPQENSSCRLTSRRSALAYP